MYRNLEVIMREFSKRKTSLVILIVANEGVQIRDIFEWKMLIDRPYALQLIWQIVVKTFCPNINMMTFVYYNGMIRNTNDGYF